ncbi:hypothetical protein ERX35_000520 [Macrococcus equipercicus]|uniref:Uncharacterized protein n=1 Tax=Macrococcus equipercicus TaxID=69967 RepID=A0ABQ6RAY6_9STAP|nr:hypothetical protein [Macrococcus equipercicus]KAA1042399.1 hypothetical protein ERX35_000520 [Macrococcus equipercicus]
MNQKIKTAVNVGAIVLVPLITERHRLTHNKDYIRMRNRTMHTLSTTKDLAAMTIDKTTATGRKLSDKAGSAKDKTVRTAEFISHTTHQLQHKTAAYQHDHAEKKKEHEDQKMIQTLSKEVERRHAQEEKALKQRQKEMKKALKAADKREQQIPAAHKQATQFLHQQIAKQQTEHDAFHDVNDYIENRVLAHEYEDNTANAPLFNRHRLEMAEHLRRLGKY